MRNAGEPADWAGTLREGTAFQEFVNGLNLRDVIRSLAKHDLLYQKVFFAMLLFVFFYIVYMQEFITQKKNNKVIIKI